MIEELEETCEHGNEMTRFVEYINKKLEKKNDENNQFNEKSKNENENENDKQINDNKNNNSNNNKKKKSKENKNEINDNEEKELYFKDIDALLNYINEETDSKKGKKKGKKGKKNKKQNKKEEKEEKEIVMNNYYDYINNNLGYEFEKEFQDFKKDIEANSINNYNTHKIIPCLSNEFLKTISSL